MTKQYTVAVLYGGRSAEREVSLNSARNITRAIDPETYNIVPIRIDHEGRWHFHGPLAATLPWDDATDGVVVALTPGGRGRLMAADGGDSSDLPFIDVVFPALHGLFGEDGTVQGYAELVDVAFVGCGVLSSAICMDKDMAKQVMAAHGIAVARSSTISLGDAIDSGAVVQSLGLPLFVKPARQGSSVGVSKATDEAALVGAVEMALRYDDKALIEEFVSGREIECSVLQRPDGSLIVSSPGEIITSSTHEFYTYDAKYLDPDGAKVQAPADVPTTIADATKSMAAQAFRALGCAGMARVDFFLLADGRLMVNEVNTLPGFTNSSMYPKALEADGMAQRETVGILIEHAMARHQRSAVLR